VTSARELPAARPAEHVDRLFRAAYALCGSGRDAERLAEKAVGCVLACPRPLRRRDPRRQLMRALRDAWIELERARAERPAIGGPEAVDWVVERSGDRPGLAADVEAAYNATRELSPTLREAIVAVDVFGLSHREAARALGIRQRTLQSRLARARDHVSTALPAGEDAT
jgi:RNA polymerase sigma-70 factor, ECF subfamily